MSTYEQRAEEKAQAKLDAERARINGHRVKSIDALEFSVQFQVYEYIIDDIIQPGFVYAITGKTGHGKTAVITLFELSLATGEPIASHAVTQGKVLCLCGENPTDKQARILAACQRMNIAPPDNLRIIAGAFPIAAHFDEIIDDAKTNGPYVAVTVDTSAAYFQGGDDNDNVQMQIHASELRDLTRIMGGPSVIVLCHPTKSAARDNLLPRGGGAFLAEIDGNLTCWAEGEKVTLHHQGKLRGASFEPLEFKLEQTALDGKFHSNGKPIMSVVVSPISESEAMKMERAEFNDENRVLYAMLHSPHGSLAEWARDCGWETPAGPLKMKVTRLLSALEEAKLVRKVRRKWRLTDAGKGEAQRDKS